VLLIVSQLKLVRKEKTTTKNNHFEFDENQHVHSFDVIHYFLLNHEANGKNVNLMNA
jgi:hypothetical protein